MLASVRLLRPRILCGSLFTVLHNLWLALGFIIASLAIYLSRKPGLVADDSNTGTTLAAMSTLLLVCAVVAHIASYRKIPWLLYAYLFMCCTATAYGIVGAKGFLSDSRALEQRLSQLPQGTLLRIAADLGLDGVNVQLIIKQVHDTQYWLFTLFVSVALSGMCVAAATLVFLSSLRKTREMLTPAGIMRAKAEARAVMVTATIRNQGQYDMSLATATSENLRTTQDIALSKARVAAQMIGRAALAAKARVAEDGADPYKNMGDDGVVRKPFQSRVYPVQRQLQQVRSLARA